MQIPCGVHPEVSAEGAIWEVATALGEGVSGVGAAEGMRNWGGALDGGSCAHAAVDSPEVLRVAGAEVSEGQECHPPRVALRREASERGGTALLGTGLLGVDGGPQRGCRPKVHRGGKEGRPTPRSVGTVRGSQPLWAVHKVMSPLIEPLNAPRCPFHRTWTRHFK